jgi:hypothetical protein
MGRSWLPTMVAAATLLLGGRGFAAECRIVADFAENTVGAFPEDWTPKEERAREIYRLLDERGVRFIRATAHGTGLHIGREFEWDLRTHPVLAWKWRPRTFPPGSDERESRRNDSVLGVYAAFPHSPASVKAGKYVWSRVVPAGTTASASQGVTQMIVLRTGMPHAAGWVEERVNVAKDYQRLFGEAPKSPRGIALLTDADDTESTAIGDYTAFRVCPEPR